jgi:hypothetical protein
MKNESENVYSSVNVLYNEFPARDFGSKYELCAARDAYRTTFNST